MVKLFVAGIPDNLHEIGLIELFSLHAMVSSIKLITDKTTGESLGYGFIEVEDIVAANRVIEALDGIKVGNRKLNVKIAEERKKPVVVKQPFVRRPGAGAAEMKPERRGFQANQAGKSKRPRLKSE